jgi:hypothetical protein
MFAIFWADFPWLVLCVGERVLSTAAKYEKPYEYSMRRWKGLFPTENHKDVFTFTKTSTKCIWNLCRYYFLALKQGCKKIVLNPFQKYLHTRLCKQKLISICLQRMKTSAYGCLPWLALGASSSCLSPSLFISCGKLYLITWLYL